MVHSLGHGILPHVAPASVELHAVPRHPVLELRCPEGMVETKKRGIITSHKKFMSWKTTKQTLSSPVLGHGSCGGIQSVLSVELQAAIYEGSAHTDLSLQLGQLVLHSLLLMFVRTKTETNRSENKQNKQEPPHPHPPLQTCRSAMVFPKAFLCIT